MRGQPLSYLEWVLALTEMAKGRVGLDRIGDYVPLALTDEEAELAATLLGRAEAMPKLHRKLFFPVKRLCVTIPTECVVVRPTIENPEEVLLALRPSDDPYYNGWHSTGCFHVVGATNAQSIAACIAKEVGCNVRRAEWVTTINHPTCPRGHEYDCIWLVELASNPTPEAMEKHRLQWFEFGMLPPNILKCHLPLFAKVWKWVNYYQSLPDEPTRKAFLEATRPAESLEE